MNTLIKFVFHFISHLEVHSLVPWRSGCNFKNAVFSKPVLLTGIIRYYDDNALSDECHRTLLIGLLTQQWLFDRFMKGRQDRPPSFNTLRPRQNGRHFADDTLKCTFFNENV